MTALDDLLAVAVEAVDRGAARLRSAGPPGERQAKGDRDYATEVDLAIERDLRAFLADTTPGIGFLGEEDGGAALDEGRWWTLDPIDGTVNFAHGSPLCAVSLALMAGDRPVVGVIAVPLLGDRYTAVAGGGAHRNGAPISVRAAGDLADAVVAIGDYAVGEGAEARNRRRLAVTARLARRVLRVRMLGSAAIDLAWLADGRLDASITLVNNPWDMAAGVVIAQEAGAVVHDGAGGPYTARSPAVVASAPALVDPLRRLLDDGDDDESSDENDDGSGPA